MSSTIPCRPSYTPSLSRRSPSPRSSPHLDGGADLLLAELVRRAHTEIEKMYRATALSGGRGHAPRWTLEWSPEVQNVPVRIHDFEPAQLVRVVAKRLPERNATGCELLGQRVRISSIDVRVPPGPVMSAGIRRRLHLGRDGLEHEPNAVSLQHGEVWIILGAEKRYF